MKQHLLQHLQKHQEEYYYIVKDLYEHPEIGNQETRSMHVLCDQLEKEGFDVIREYIVPTGFLAIYKSEKPGPVIAYLCEYDALPEIGHGCGHNLIAGISVGAGCALKSILSEIGGEVRVIGTPAEENFGGKVIMAEKHAFDDVDAALMLHPDTANTLGARSLAIYPLRFEFHGKNAHACHPENGNSALDAAVMSYMSINLLRQFARPNTFIHGVITHGGEAANVIPAYACMDYYFRGETMDYVKELCEKAKQCVEGACAMTGCTCDISTYETPYDDCLINYTLADLLSEEYEELSYSWEKVDEIPSGSTDVGSVSYCCPTLQGYIKIADEYVNGHSIEMADATISEKGRQALIDGAYALANIGRRLIVEKDLLEKAKKEFSQRKEK